MKTTALLIASLALLISAIAANPVSADWRSDAYIGGGVGVSMPDGCEGDNRNNCKVPDRGQDNISAFDFGFKAFGGYRFHDYFGFELAYYDLVSRAVNEFN